MDKQRNITSQNSDFKWNDTIDDFVVEILATAIKRFKEKEKQRSPQSYGTSREQVFS